MSTFETPEIPKSTGSFMKLEKGDNKFRILASPLAGYKYWIDENGKRKPQRFLSVEEANPKLITDKNPLKYFWAFPVWDYTTESVMILELTQVTILRAIQAMTNDPDWGDPCEFDVVVTRTGDGLETEYTIMPKPAKKLDEIAQAVWDTVKENCDMGLLMNNKNPLRDVESAKIPSDKPEEEISIDDIPF